MDTPAQLKQGVWKPISIWKKAVDLAATNLNTIYPAAVQCMKRNYNLMEPRVAVQLIRERFGISDQTAWSIYNKVKTEGGEHWSNKMNGWRRMAAPEMDSLTMMIEEGLKDETEGHEFWTNTAQALRGAGMAEESRQAEQFANQEIGHHRFLEMLKTKTSPTAPQRAQDEQSEPIIRFMKRNYDMLPSDVVHKTRENFKISEKDAWELYQKVKTEYGERKGSNNGWRRIADDSVIQMAPTFGLPQGLPQGFTGEQQTTTQGQTQGIPQETSQYGRQPDGMYKYIYQNASVLVNPNLNNIIVNVYVNGSDENSIQVGLNSATQIANNAATVYAITIQMPVQLLSRLNHTPHGNYITVPFTFQANKIEQTTPTQQGTTASSWKSMQKLQ